MASAKRLIELRHDCRSSSRMAEISVPACPIPIHHTKLTMANPQPMGMVTPQMPDSFDKQVGDGEQQHHQEQKGHPKTDEPPVGSRTSQHDRADLVRDRAQGVAGFDDRGALVFDWVCHDLAALRVRVFRHFQFRIWVANVGQVCGARPSVQVAQQAIVPWLGLQF